MHIFFSGFKKDSFLYKECVRKNKGFEEYMVNVISYYWMHNTWGSFINECELASNVPVNTIWYSFTVEFSINLWIWHKNVVGLGSVGGDGTELFIEPG